MNNKHVKTMQITTEQYLWDQFDKHTIIDPVEDIEKQFENQTQQNNTYSCNEESNNVPITNSTSDTQQVSTQHSTRFNHNQRKITVNNGQKDNVNNM